MTKDPVSVRRLSPADLDSVVAIDEALVGRSRRDYFQRRLQAALAHPDLHVQFAVDAGEKLVGYVLARRLAGEFGRAAPALRLEVIGVRPHEQGHGIGDALLAALDRWAAEHDVREIHTQASWRAHGMLRFFDRAGFELAPNQIVDCEVRAAARVLERRVEEAEAELELRDTPAEIDYGAPAPNAESLGRARLEVSLMKREDAPAVARIDKHLTGRDRSAYIEQAVKEAMEDTAVRVSLVARQYGGTIGFVMAKSDFGDFGRSEPVAVLDIIGVDPGFAKHGVGATLLSQLFINLGALQVERVETVVSRENFGLLGFLYKIGFGPAARLNFVRRVGP
jgi:GNAT superfamily N-acetyltransferase